MRSNAYKLLVSINFSQSKGGISRVANMIADALSFDTIVSLHGKENKSKVIWFGGKRLFFTLSLLSLLYTRRPALVVFDHLNIARVLLLVPKFLLKKVVVLLHDEEAWTQLSWFRKVTLAKATHILCNSEYTQQKFVSLNPEFESKTKLCLLGGVPNAFLEESNQENGVDNSSWFKDARPYCLMVSRLWKSQPYKGHFELLKAFQTYHINNPKASMRLAIVGNGDAADEVEKIILQYQLTEKVKLFRKVSDDELTRFYKQSSCFFFPSTGEGFGLVYLEAMSFRKACIGMAHQPAAEIIVDNQTGRLLENKEIVTLVDTIADIETNVQKYEQFGLKGFERYQFKFTNKHFYQRFLDSIGELN